MQMPGGVTATSVGTMPWQASFSCYSKESQKCLDANARRRHRHKCRDYAVAGFVHVIRTKPDGGGEIQCTWIKQS